MRTSSVRGVLMFVIAILALSRASFGQVGISVTFGPPALPVYEQPVCPGDGYIWTPGYWAWNDDDDDYFWVPGTWVLAPEVGLFWTPPYWAWANGGFVFYDGYWGPQVGFYGGINYGFGYFGDGFVGGRWDGGHFFYNREVTNVNETVIHNVYNERVVYNTTNVNRVSYNGGQGGVVARPTPQQEAAARERRIPPSAAQVQHVKTARGNRELLASANHGKPPIAATARPGQFSGREAVAAKEAGAPYHPPANRGPANRAGARPGGNEGGSARPVHPSELPPMERPAAPNTGNAKLDQKYQKQQQKLERQQENDRQKLQQQQEKEHQQMARQSANEAQRQGMEQRHQQQTQEMRDRHVQQQQQLQQRQAPRPPSKPR